MLLPQLQCAKLATPSDCRSHRGESGSLPQTVPPDSYPEAARLLFSVGGKRVSDAGYAIMQAPLGVDGDERADDCRVFGLGGYGSDSGRRLGDECRCRFVQGRGGF